MQRDWDEADVQVLMWLVRWQLRAYGWHRQYQDMLGAAYSRAWSAAAGAEALALPPAEMAKRISKAALWAAADWLRSTENEGRTHVRSHSRKVALPERVSLKEGLAVHERALLRETDSDGWVRRLIEAIDAEGEP